MMKMKQFPRSLNFVKARAMVYSLPVELFRVMAEKNGVSVQDVSNLVIALSAFDEKDDTPIDSQLAAILAEVIESTVDRKTVEDEDFLNFRGSANQLKHFIGLLDMLMSHLEKKFYRDSEQITENSPWINAFYIRTWSEWLLTCAAHSSDWNVLERSLQELRSRGTDSYRICLTSQNIDGVSIYARLVGLAIDRIKATRERGIVEKMVKIGSADSCDLTQVISLTTPDSRHIADKLDPYLRDVLHMGELKSEGCTSAVNALMSLYVKESRGNRVGSSTELVHQFLSTTRAVPSETNVANLQVLVGMMPPKKVVSIEKTVTHDRDGGYLTPEMRMALKKGIQACKQRRTKILSSAINKMKPKKPKRVDVPPVGHVEHETVMAAREADERALNSIKNVNRIRRQLLSMDVEADAINLARIEYRNKCLIAFERAMVDQTNACLAMERARDQDMASAESLSVNLAQRRAREMTIDNAFSASIHDRTRYSITENRHSHDQKMSWAQMDRSQVRDQITDLVQTRPHELVHARVQVMTWTNAPPNLVNAQAMPHL